MKYFPVVVDNFFRNPDLIRKLALSLNYAPDDKGRWPGQRSEQLHTIDYELFMSIMLKIMSIYTDFAYSNVTWENASLYFHKINDTGDKELNKGWIHIDQDFELAGLCYLNPGVNDINTGTSLHSIEDHHKYERHYYKHLYYRGDNVDINDYKKELKEHNDKYTETMRISNVYNRMITYDTKEHHCLNGIPENEERLTMLLFMSDISPEGKFPVSRIQDDKQYDNFIEERINFLL